MYNYFMLIGKVIEINPSLTNPELTMVKLKVQRSFKNKDGLYEVDIFDIQVSEPIGSIVKEHVNVNDNLSVKGRLAMINGQNHLIAERVIFTEQK